MTIVEFFRKITTWQSTRRGYFPNAYVATITCEECGCLVDVTADAGTPPGEQQFDKYKRHLARAHRIWVPGYPMP